MRICGDLIKKPFSAAFFPDQDSPIYASFNASTKMFEIEVPVSNAAGIDGSLYLDIKSLKLDAENDAENWAGLKLADDPDYINGFLILNSRTINLAAKLLTESIIKRTSK